MQFGKIERAGQGSMAVTHKYEREKLILVSAAIRWPVHSNYRHVRWTVIRPSVQEGVSSCVFPFTFNVLSRNYNTDINPFSSHTVSNQWALLPFPKVDKISVPLTPIQETPFCSRWRPFQKVVTSQMQRNTGHDCPGPTDTSTIQLLYRRLQGCCRRGAERL